LSLFGSGKMIVKDPDNPDRVARKGAYESTSGTLIDRVKLGESEAWRRLEYLYSPLVRWRCRHAGLTEADAEDIVQEVFKTVSEKIGSFQKRPGPSFRSWLKSITRYKLGDYIRRSRDPARGEGGTDAQLALGRIPDDTGGSAMEDDEDDPSDRRRLVLQALRSVSSGFEPRSRQAFWLVVVENRRPADVAAELGMTPTAVYIAKSRILGRLREVLADLGEIGFDEDLPTGADPGIDP
jgi:RNA polymerase sigma-70 factor, ECF subfamily